MQAERVDRGGIGKVIAFALIALIVYVMLNGLLNGLLLVGMVNVPTAQPVNEHATVKHIEAQTIYDRYTDKGYLCVKVYRSMAKNRLLYRFCYADTQLEGGMITTTLEGGMITTTSGIAVTAYAKPKTYWDRIIVRDSYVLVAWEGVCP